MITRTLTVVLIVLFTQQPSKVDPKQCQQDLDACRQRLAELSKSYEQLAALKKQVEDARTQLSKCQEDNKRLTSSNADQPHPNPLQKELDAARQQLQGCQEQRQQLLASNADLNNQIAELRRAQNDFDLRLSTARQESHKYQSENAQISSQLKVLQERFDSQGQQLLSASKELQASKQTVSDLAKQAVAQGQPSKMPEAVLALARAFQERADHEGAAPVIMCDENGRVHVIRELVIGTLDTDYPKEITPGQPLTLNAVFKPHPIITPGALAEGAVRDAINWYIELNYKPQKGQASYDRRTSGQKPERREVDPNGSDEKWAWTITTPSDFDSDTSDLIVFADYKMGPTTSQPKDIVHEKITFAATKRPGVIASGVSLVKEYVAWLLAAVIAFQNVWLGFRRIKKGND